jgi:DNA-binding MarR family transcriptional regulator
VLHAAMLLMRSVSAHLRQTSKQPLAPAQLGTLLKIGAGPCTLSELARHQAVSLPTVSRSVDMLVRRGWVERTMDDTDRRQMLLGLTEQGREVLADVKARAEQHIAAKLSSMSSSDRADLAGAAGLLASVFTDRSAAKDSSG